jgi:signal transduction histidine kinase
VPGTVWRPTVAEDRSGIVERVRAAFGTVRVRTTAVAVIVVGVALAVAAVAMVVLLRRSLTSDVRAAATLRAEAVADALESGDVEAALSGGGDEEFVQVVDTSGDVVASSENLAGEEAVAHLRPGGSESLDAVPFDDDPFLVVAVSGGDADAPLVVMAGRSLEPVTESSRAVAGLLAAGVPLLLLIVGLVEWRIVGRALAPVESIRSEVEAISTRELHRRVPDPPGTDEIARLAATMNQMLERLERGRERERRFVSDASHELRSPVATIRQHAEVALAHPDGTSLEELAEVVLEEDVRLQRLVEDLLLLARMDEGSLVLASAPVDLDDLLFEEAERVRGIRGLHVDVSGVSAGRVSGDRKRLATVVRNLGDNAARHAASAVAFSLVRRGDDVVLGVEDDGDGIPPAERERIFERFVRLEEARDRDSGGSGLGLAIVAEIAEVHGAKVSVGTGALGGARFEVRFPAA